MEFVADGLPLDGEISWIIQPSPVSSPRPSASGGRDGDASVGGWSAEGLDPSLLALRMAEGAPSPQMHGASSLFFRGSRKKHIPAST